jgi:hypothetical protein
MRKAFVVGLLVLAVGCGSSSAMLPKDDAGSESAGDDATAAPDVGPSADAPSATASTDSALPLVDAAMLDSAVTALSQDAAPVPDARADVDASHAPDASESAALQDSSLESGAKAEPEASTQEHEASTPLPEASTTVPACLAAGVVCTSTPNSCCSGICSAPLTGSEQSVCAAPCTIDAQCASGCCAPEINTGMLACAPRGFCLATCAGPSAACTTSLDCCANETCVTTNGGSCASLCTVNADCLSGCCAPLSNASVSVCSAFQFCL